MEFRFFVSKSFLPRAQSTEVLDGLGDYVVVQIEVDPTGLLYSHISQANNREKGIAWAQLRREQAIRAHPGITLTLDL